MSDDMVKDLSPGERVISTRRKWQGSRSKELKEKDLSIGERVISRRERERLSPGRGVITKGKTCHLPGERLVSEERVATRREISKTKKERKKRTNNLCFSFTPPYRFKQVFKNKFKVFVMPWTCLARVVFYFILFYLNRDIYILIPHPAMFQII